MIARGIGGSMLLRRSCVVLLSVVALCELGVTVAARGAECVRVFGLYSQFRAHPSYGPSVGGDPSTVGESLLVDGCEPRVRTTYIVPGANFLQVRWERDRRIPAFGTLIDLEGDRHVLRFRSARDSLGRTVIESQLIPVDLPGHNPLGGVEVVVCPRREGTCYRRTWWGMSPVA